MENFTINAGVKITDLVIPNAGDIFGCNCNIRVSVSEARSLGLRIIFESVRTVWSALGLFQS